MGQVRPYLSINEVERTENFAAEQIVESWNEIVNRFENRTIEFCLKVKEILAEFPEESVKNIFRKVSQHPNLKHGISLDRVWAGVRLINKRPDVIEYYKAEDGTKEGLYEPLLKADGAVNFEFYIEMYKHKIDEGVRVSLEERAKDEGWGYRRLLEEIRDSQDKLALTTGDEKILKSVLMREILGLLRSKPLSFIREVRFMIDEIGKQDG